MSNLVEREAAGQLNKHINCKQEDNQLHSADKSALTIGLD